MKRKADKSIILRYVINGARFKLRFVQQEAKRALSRVEVLRSNGIEVKVSGMPKESSHG